MRLPRLTIAALMGWVAYLAALIAAFVAAALGYALAGRESEGGS
jgi:hypothetical protein